MLAKKFFHIWTNYLDGQTTIEYCVLLECYKMDIVAVQDLVISICTI